MNTRRGNLVLAAAGFVVLVLCSVVAHDGNVGTIERGVFHAINDLPSSLYKPLWVFQQLGNLAVAGVIGFVGAAVLRSPKLALGVTIVLVAKLIGERIVKQFVERQRPGTTIADAILRGDVPPVGPSFVSGHMVLAVALATLFTPALSGNWKWLPWVFAACIGVARIYVGAHNPLDIVGGAALGLVIGGLTNAALGPQVRR